MKNKIKRFWKIILVEVRQAMKDRFLAHPLILVDVSSAHIIIEAATNN